jgi:uncharacterized protein (TIGR00369 family)
MSDPWREPVRGGYPEPRCFALSGAELLRALRDGDVPQPPISRLTGMRLTDVGPGRATFTMPLTEWLCAPQGSIGIGPLVIPADAAMACAIQTELGPGARLSTTELTLRLLAPAPIGTTVSVEGRLIQLRKTIGLAGGTVTDERGRLIAHGSTLCLIGPPVAGTPPPAFRNGVRSDRDPADPASDPWTRPAAGTVLGQEIWDRAGGLEVLSAQLAGELPQPPLHHLTGVTLSAVGAGEASFEMPTSEWLCAPARGRVQGGGVAVLAELALSAAIQTGVPAGTALAPIDVKLNYLRPLPADGRLATAHGAVVHMGRRVAVANSRVLDADGRTTAVATGSAVLLPGRRASLGAAEN